MLDLVLAIGHHLLVFGLFGVLFAELIAVRRGMDAAAVARIAAVDLWYGILAGLIVAVGFSRAVFAAKGWHYYEHNGFFWAKIATFVVIGRLAPGGRRSDGCPDQGRPRLSACRSGAVRPCPRLRRRHGARLRGVLSLTGRGLRVRRERTRPGCIFDPTGGNIG